jgi:hypothetical protein
MDILLKFCRKALRFAYMDVEMRCSDKVESICPY